MTLISIYYVNWLLFVAAVLALEQLTESSQKAKSSVLLYTYCSENEFGLSQ